MTLNFRKLALVIIIPPAFSLFLIHNNFELWSAVTWSLALLGVFILATYLLKKIEGILMARVLAQYMLSVDAGRCLDGQIFCNGIMSFAQYGSGVRVSGDEKGLYFYNIFCFAFFLPWEKVRLRLVKERTNFAILSLVSTRSSLDIAIPWSLEVETLRKKVDLPTRVHGFNPQ